MLHNPRLLDVLEVLTVGLPFCIFKLLSGFLLGIWGIPLLLLGGLDALLNGANLLALLILGRRILPKCTISRLLRGSAQTQAKAEWAAALDVALSFAIVAVAIGGGFLRQLGPREVQTWNIAVVLNVLGAGLFQVHQAYVKLKKQEAAE